MPARQFYTRTETPFLFPDSELLEITERYFIYYRKYSNRIKKQSNRHGNIFLCIKRNDLLYTKRDRFYRQGGFDLYVEYSDKEWPRMKTVPPELKERAQSFRGFIDLRDKLLRNK